MKNIITLALILLTITIAEAQQADYYSYNLENTTPLRAKVYYNSLINISKNSDINVDSILYNYLDRFISKKYTGNTKARNSNIWLTSPLFSMTNNKSDADVIVSGSYSLNKNIEAVEKLMFETSSSYNTPIPYFEIESTNEANLDIILNFKYSNNTLVDTISIAHKSKRKPGAKQKTIDELVSKCNKSLKLAFYNEFNFIERKAHNYRFPKVKIKDKTLKEEYKNAKDLLKNGDITKLGNFYKHVYEEGKTKEAAYCLGICYELIGNFPQAQEYYKQLPDFHTKTRMKNSMKLYNYLQEIGIKLQLIEF